MDAMRVVYSLILAFLVVLTAATGIQAAYPGPEEPAGADIFEDPSRLGEIEDFKAEDADYERNVFLMGTALAVVVAVVGLIVLPLGLPIRLGLLIGGLLTLVWAAEPDITHSVLLVGQDVTAEVFPEGRLDTTSRLLQFLTSLAALAVVLLAGRLRFPERPVAPAGRRGEAAVEGESQVEVEREELHER
jgi:hypothetical protein